MCEVAANRNAINLLFFRLISVAKNITNGHITKNIYKMELEPSRLLRLGRESAPVSMEIEGLQLLPVRPRNLQSNLKPPLKKKICLTNYYPIKIKKQPNLIYQYLIITKPEIPADSNDLIHSAIKSIKK